MPVDFTYVLIISTLFIILANIYDAHLLILCAFITGGISILLICLLYDSYTDGRREKLYKMRKEFKRKRKKKVCTEL